MKSAIVFYSLEGNTKSVAEKIAAKVDSDIIELVPEKSYPSKGFKKFIWGGKSAVMGETPKLKEYSFDADKYDRVIFGTPVWASNFTPPLRTFITENKEALNGKKYSAFICFSGGGADKALTKLKNELGVENFESELILVDPKSKPSDENEKKIEEFIKRLEA